jgi:putative ATP-dependent endonuclease of OLD family
VSHKLAEVLITNYRSCGSTEVKLSDFTALIGYNNAGKSNIISAIQWLARKSSLQEGDFLNPDDAIEVVGIIDGITQLQLNGMGARHSAAISPYITDGILKIKRTQLMPGAKAAEIRLSVWNQDTNAWIPNPGGIDNAIGDLLPEPIRIGAMENAAEDSAKSKSTTTIGKLLAEFTRPVKEAHEAELSLHLSEISRRISCEGDSRLGEFAEIDRSVNSKVNDLFPGMSVKLHFETPTFDDIIKAGTIKVYEGAGGGRDFSSYGHGAQRSIQIALIQYLAEVKRVANNPETTTLLMIDEPELYLHPFAIEQVREALISLSSSGYQVVISTHSAQMITPEHAEKALLVRKDGVRGTYTRVRLRDAISRIVPNANHQMEQLFNLSHSSQVLFAEKVVLAEGKTERKLLPLIFKAESGMTLGQEKIALVAQSGVNDTNKSLQILQAMDLPAKAIADLDYGLTGAIRDGFVLVQDPDVIALKQILSNLSQQAQITLNGNGVPKDGIVTAARAFEILAAIPEAHTYIENLHATLKAQNIWLWKKGAIEAHIGTGSKDERAWAQFKSDVMANGLENVCPDYQLVQDLVVWLRA